MSSPASLYRSSGPRVWDVTRPDGLGVTPDLGEAGAYLPTLRAALAGVLVAAAGRDLVFVGRSPDPLRAYLSGLLGGVAVTWRVSALNVSLLNATLTPAQATTLRPLLAGVGLRPGDLVREDRCASLVDVVASGGTFAQLHRVLRDWAAEDGLGTTCVARRVSAVGLLRAGYARPGALRWSAQPELRRVQTSSVLTDPALWSWLAEDSPKLAPRFPVPAWPSPPLTLPGRSDETLGALAQARALVLVGQDRAERQRMAAALICAGGLADAGLRPLIRVWKGKQDQRPTRTPRRTRLPRPR
ncbi:hypothetical protein [Deinococcus soli (ex Cha et al. 2016)]|uniref:hypothetical protein n=1 Tax=Deinococcus soli (ex Cha et al. 2016) TaxID=1309411 RepID=UPI0016662730|nr:hypothetical protein [Deinococcus soli (ex Cha et al. 2016)]